MGRQDSEQYIIRSRYFGKWARVVGESVEALRDFQGDDTGVFEALLQVASPNQIMRQPEFGGVLRS